MGYSPWGRKESDMTERLTLSPFSHIAADDLALPTPVFLPGTSYGQRSLVGYSPWGCNESDMTRRTCAHNAHIDD